MAPPGQHHRRRRRGGPHLRGVQEVRGLLGVRPHEVPHGPRPHRQHHRPHHLVRRVDTRPEADHPRVHLLHLTRAGDPPTLRRRLVAHRPAIHRPDRIQHLPLRRPRPGEERPPLLPREDPHAPLHPVGHQVRRHRQDQAPPRQPQVGTLPPADVIRGPSPGLLRAGVRVPLLHIPVDRGVHAPVRVGGEQRDAVRRGLRLPVRSPKLHPGAEAAEVPERRRGGRRDGQRHRPRDRGARNQPAGQRLVRGARPDRAGGDRRPLRGDLRHRRGWVLHGADAPGPRRRHLQYERDQEEVLGSVALEPRRQLLYWPQCPRPVKVKKKKP